MIERSTMGYRGCAWGLAEVSSSHRTSDQPSHSSPWSLWTAGRSPVMPAPGQTTIRHCTWGSFSNGWQPC